MNAVRVKRIAPPAAARQKWLSYWCGQILVVAIENGWELEWFTPGVFEKYLAGGETVQVAANANIEVKVKAQP